MLLGPEGGFLYFISEVFIGPVCFLCADFILMEIISVRVLGSRSAFLRLSGAHRSLITKSLLRCSPSMILSVQPLYTDPRTVIVLNVVEPCYFLLSLTGVGIDLNVMVARSLVIWSIPFKVFFKASGSKFTSDGVKT